MTTGGIETQSEVADAALIRSVIQRVATGPELSKNISHAEAKAVMHALLDGSANPVQAGVFLIGLRMKRETDDEMKGILDALCDRTQTVTSQVADVVDIADPYNGFNRTLPASLFVLPTLAACGVTAYSHGVEIVGPKYGLTHHVTLRALGADPLRSVQMVSERLADPAIGWGYVDQSAFCPSLYALNELRTLIVKRPVLTTLEVLLGPIKGAARTHLVTGYVHKPYPPIYTMLARHVGFDSALLIRGTEGGVVPSFRQRGRVVRYSGQGDDAEVDVEPDELGLRREYRAADVPESTPPAARTTDHIGMKWDLDALAKTVAQAGERALDGEQGPILDGVIFSAALVLWHLKIGNDLKQCAEIVRNAIASGEASRRLHAGI